MTPLKSEDYNEICYLLEIWNNLDRSCVVCRLNSTADHSEFYDNNVSRIAEYCICGGIKRHQATLVSDSSLPEDELKSRIKKNTRYEIRRAKRDGVFTKQYESKELPEDLLRSFVVTYNEMYKSKGIKQSFN